LAIARSTVLTASRNSRAICGAVQRRNIRSRQIVWSTSGVSL